MIDNYNDSVIIKFTMWKKARFPYPSVFLRKISDRRRLWHISQSLLHQTMHSSSIFFHYILHTTSLSLERWWSILQIKSEIRCVWEKYYVVAMSSENQGSSSGSRWQDYLGNVWIKSRPLTLRNRHQRVKLNKFNSFVELRHNYVNRQDPAPQLRDLTQY